MNFPISTCTNLFIERTVLILLNDRSLNDLYKLIIVDSTSLTNYLLYPNTGLGVLMILIILIQKENHQIRIRLFSIKVFAKFCKVISHIVYINYDYICYKAKLVNLWINEIHIYLH